MSSKPKKQRKEYGDSYLLPVETNSHGEFTSYANFGITHSVPGYWGPVLRDPLPVGRAINRYCLSFFDAYLRDDNESLNFLRRNPPAPDLADAIQGVEHSAGRIRLLHKEELVQWIIETGMDRAMPAIEEARAFHADETLFEENVFNWLGYHFLYWWGHEEDAVAVFELNAEIFPESANAFDSLGEAYAQTGNREKAVTSYCMSLKLNPENTNAIQALEDLEASD